jgi:ABC-type sugar transport system substrate-binding protein
MTELSTMDLVTLAQKQLTRRGLLRSAAAIGVAAALLPLADQFAGAQADKPLKIAFSVPGLNFPFFVHMMDLAEQHAKEIGNIEFVKLDGQQNGAPSSTKQSSDLEAMVAEKVNGIVISPNDVNALAPSIQTVIDAGIPVVTVDRNVTEAKTLAHVGADNVLGGELQGKFLVQILPDGGDIYELQGQPGATPAIDRHKGLTNVLAKQDKIKVVVSQTAEFARDKAISVTESALAGNPEPKAIVCANDDMAFGASEAARDAGLSIPIVGFDALPEALQAIQAGTQAATIEQFPGQQARTAIDILVAFLRNNEQPKQHDTYLNPKLLTKDNLGEAERAEEAGITPTGSPAAATPVA